MSAGGSDGERLICRGENWKGERAVTNKTEQLQVLCVYCDAPWTVDMESRLISISEGCPTCDYGREIVVVMTIKCHNCKRVVYSKETTV